MPDPVLSKLLAADSDLEAQEAKLIAQLESIKTKRDSLKTVVEIFKPDKTTAAVTSQGEEEEEVPASTIAEGGGRPIDREAQKGSLKAENKSNNRQTYSAA